MLNRTWIILAIGVLVCPQVLAQASPDEPAHGNGNQNCAPPFPVTALLGFLAAGTILFCVDAPAMTSTTTSSFQVEASIIAPALLGGVGTNSITLVPATGGCTAGTVSTRGTTFNSAFGTQFSATAFITMSSDSCSLLWEGKITVNSGTTVIYDQFESTFTYANPTSKIDNQNRLCASSSFGATCTTPTIDEVISGTLNVAQSGTWTMDNTNRLCASSSLGTSCTTPTINLGGTVAISQSGTWQIDNQNRLCASSNFGTSCTTPTVNGGTVTVTPGGVQHLVLDSLPTLQVAQSGTWSIDNQNRLCNASALGTACTTPTINAAITGTLTVTNTGGQTITVSGTLDNLNRICAASPLGSTCTVATINTNTISTIMGNSTQTVNFPGNLTIDLHSRGGLNNANGPGYDWWLELTFWILVFWYIMRNENLFMLVFALGGVIHLVNSSWFFGLAQSLPWLALGALLDLFIRNRSRRREERKKKGAMK